MDQKLEALARVPLLADLKPKELEEVGQLSDIVDVEAGYVLMREGAPGHEFFVILAGSVAIETGGRTVASLGPNDFLGEIALIDHGRRTATATTTTPARLIVMGTQEFKSLLSQHADIALTILEALAKRVRANSTDPTD